MPTNNIDDRKNLARLAIDRGWAVADVRQHPNPNAEQKANNVLFEVHYVKGEDAGIVVMYNAIDKMVSAHLQAGDRHDHAYRTITVEGWLENYGDPEQQVVFGNGKAKLLRNKEIVAEAERGEDDVWRISLPHLRTHVVTISGLPENVQRKLVIAALGAL